MSQNITSEHDIGPDLVLSHNKTSAFDDDDGGPLPFRIAFGGASYPRRASADDDNYYIITKGPTTLLNQN